ncbi:sensor histidine kinase [Amycolatopsis minnesotensis]|uniref:histidine kinase n=1 Tax=Amycolatopsis minnesotensis TaxID=337894 RepID=A0ABP5DDF0_9PSEU
MTMAIGATTQRSGRSKYILRGAALFGISLAAIAVAAWLIIAVCLCAVGVGIYLVPSAMSAVRGLVNTQRRLAGDWSGVQIADPYRNEPEFPKGLKGSWQRTYWALGDGTTWRQLLWLIVEPYTGGLIALLPAALLLNGLFGLAMPFVWEQRLAIWENSFYGFIPLNSQLMAIFAAGLGVVQIAICGFVARPLVGAHAKLTKWWLRPSNARLASRVEQLQQTRYTAVDTSAAELRRIERDLHDGAQSRLVAMGMTLSAAENLVEDNPDAVRALLSEAKESSTKALNELRDLVRGIHPPVLADRGLVDAVKALALDAPIPVELSGGLPARPQPPVESAAYFAVSEVLNNVLKHAHASAAGVEFSHEEELIRINVTDNGCGGADAARGTGLRGLEERLAAFDGYLSVVSPVGGPTLVSIVIPNALPTR